MKEKISWEVDLFFNVKGQQPTPSMDEQNEVIKNLGENSLLFLNLSNKNLKYCLNKNQIFRALNTNNSLISLDLSKCSLKEKDAQELLSALKTNLTLTHLNLSNNSDIKPETIQQINQILEKNKGQGLSITNLFKESKITSKM